MARQTGNEDSLGNEVTLSARNPRNDRIGPNRKWLKRLAFLVYVVALCELAMRGYWKVRHGVPFFDMRQIFVGRFYPELRDSGVLTTSITQDDESLDVLILGGSVVTSSFGPIDKLLEQQLTETTGRPVRVFNCANLALNSLDSRWKYERLTEQRFDLVVVYESINEARLNNCPREFFRDDYRHSSWYSRIAALQDHPELTWFALPYSIHYLAIGTFDHPALGWYLPKHTPANAQWPQLHGSDVKTAISYRHNLERIIELAKERRATVLLPQYAFHIPDDAALALYQRDKLGNWATGRKLETWGTAEGVTASIVAHNEVIRDLAASHRHVLTLDMNALLPHKGDVFVDPCHLSPRGCELFVENLREPLKTWCDNAALAKIPPDHSVPTSQR